MAGPFGIGGDSQSDSSSRIKFSDSRVAAQDQAVVLGTGAALSGTGPVLNINTKGKKGSDQKLVLQTSIERADVDLIEKGLGQVLGLASESQRNLGLATTDALKLADVATQRALEAQGAVGELGGLKEIAKIILGVGAIAALGFAFAGGG